MNELTLTELDMGFSIPKILRASKPSVDHQGRKKITLGVFLFFFFTFLWVLSRFLIFILLEPLINSVFSPTRLLHLSYHISILFLFSLD